VVTVEGQRYEGDVERLQRILDGISAAMNQPNLNLLRQISTPGFQSLQRNIFRYNDPTASGHDLAVGSNGVKQGLAGPQQPQHSSHLSLTGNGQNNNNGQGFEQRNGQVQAQQQGQQNGEESAPTNGRSATLPRSTYLVSGSVSKRPARDLNTADDYVLFSALDSEGEHYLRVISKVRFGRTQCNRKIITPHLV
jgi:hypothetical protein